MLLILVTKMAQLFTVLVYLLALLGVWMSTALPIPDDAITDGVPGSDTVHSSNIINIQIPFFPGPIKETFTIATEPATESVAPSSQDISNQDIVKLYDSSSDVLGNCQIILGQMSQRLQQDNKTPSIPMSRCVVVPSAACEFNATQQLSDDLTALDSLEPILEGVINFENTLPLSNGTIDVVYELLLTMNRQYDQVMEDLKNTSGVDINSGDELGSAMILATGTGATAVPERCSSTSSLEQQYQNMYEIEEALIQLSIHINCLKQQHQSSYSLQP